VKAFSISAHLLVPAFGGALAVDKRQRGVNHLRCETHFVVRDVWQDCQTILRHVLTLPVWSAFMEVAAEFPEDQDVVTPQYLVFASTHGPFTRRAPQARSGCTSDS
jgi:hypothetical protein